MKIENITKTFLIMNRSFRTQTAWKLVIPNWKHLKNKPLKDTFKIEPLKKHTSHNRASWNCPLEKVMPQKIAKQIRDKIQSSTAFFGKRLAFYTRHFTRRRFVFEMINIDCIFRCVKTMRNNKNVPAHHFWIIELDSLQTKGHFLFKFHLKLFLSFVWLIRIKNGR